MYGGIDFAQMTIEMMFLMTSVPIASVIGVLVFERKKRRVGVKEMIAKNSKTICATCGKKTRKDNAVYDVSVNGRAYYCKGCGLQK